MHQALLRAVEEPVPAAAAVDEDACVPASQLPSGEPVQPYVQMVEPSNQQAQVDTVDTVGPHAGQDAAPQELSLDEATEVQEANKGAKPQSNHKVTTPQKVPQSSHNVTTQ